MPSYRNQKRIYLNTRVFPNPADLQMFGFTYDNTYNAWVYSTGNLGKYRRPASPTIIVRDICVEVKSCGGATLEMICRLYEKNIIRFTKINDVKSRIAYKEKQIIKLQAEIDKLKKEVE